MVSNELPDHNNPIYPVTCITLYDNFKEEYFTWYINEQIAKDCLEAEKSLLYNFIKYFKDNPPDIWFSWNVSFDYNYIYARYKKLFSKDLGKDLSPINSIR